MKSAQLRIRMGPDLHEQFLAICHERDESMVQVLRRFMRAYVESYQEHSQKELFPHADKRRAVF